jgi:hypothetical protein
VVIVRSWSRPKGAGVVIPLLSIPTNWSKKELDRIPRLAQNAAIEASLEFCQSSFLWFLMS